MLNQKFYNIGFIKNTHGINGFLEIKLIDNKINLKNFINKNLFILIKENFENYKPFSIENVLIKKHNFIVKLKTLDNINDIKHYVKNQLYLLVSDLNDLKIIIEKNIIGYNVINIKNNQNIGKIISVNSETNNKFISFLDFEKNKNIMVPFVDKFIIKIDYESENVFVELIAGL